MGACFSMSPSWDQALNQVINCLWAEGAYIRNLEGNLKDLTTAVQKLKAKRDDLLTRVTTEENRGLQRLAEVERWLHAVDTTENEVGELLNLGTDEVQQKLCLCGYASKNCVSSYRYGKKVLKTKQAVESLESELEKFKAVTKEVPAPAVDERPIEPAVGMQTMLEEAWKRLMDDEVGILGLYGMGGVGKTTLLTQINNKFCESTNEFDVVIWVGASQVPRPETIQDEIGKKLDIFDEGWRQKRQEEKASDIFKVLRGKKFVLLLDDIWKKVNLIEIGVPFPNTKNGCKVAFTTRSREVCGRMGAKEIEVRCLAPDVAWDLFRKRVGEDTLNSHPDIPELAKNVAEKCHGLPLALKIISETMAPKTKVAEWRNAIDVLKSSAAKFPGMEDGILRILKFSYDNLRDAKVKSCFLYCALFPEDCSVVERWLVDYWVGEGIIDGKKERGRVEDEGYEIMGTLLHACLLEKGDEGESIKMHDVVRKMALWISSDSGEQKEKFVVEAGVGLDQIPEVKDWKGVSRMSLMRNEIKNISDSPNCPKLLTLFLNSNRLVNISSEFFRSMPSLVVLDLSRNANLEGIPEEVSMLVSLQYLNLSRTGIKQLPNSLKELKKLLYLDLRGARKIQSVNGISSLSNLQILRLLGSSVRLSVSLVEDLTLLEHLNCLTISIGDAHVMERFQEGNHKLRHCTEELCIQGFSSTPEGISFASTDLDCLHRLVIWDSDIREIKIDWESKPSRVVSPLHHRKSPYKSCFPNLHRVWIDNCKGLTELTWLLFAPNVAYLFLEDLRDLKEIISKEKVVNDTDEQPFEKLQHLELCGLPQLETIYWDPLPFPFLQNIHIVGCPKLRNLPVNSKSAKGKKLKILANRMWMGEDLEWEDEDTKQRFCSGS